MPWETVLQPSLGRGGQIFPAPAAPIGSNRKQALPRQAQFWTTVPIRTVGYMKKKERFMCCQGPEYS